MGDKMITKKTLHKVEMNLVWLLENKELTREKIIDNFTTLMSEI